MFVAKGALRWSYDRGELQAQHKKDFDRCVAAARRFKTGVYSEEKCKAGLDAHMAAFKPKKDRDSFFNKLREASKAKGGKKGAKTKAAKIKPVKR